MEETRMQKGNKHNANTKLQISESMKRAWSAAQSAPVAEAPRSASDTSIDDTACTLWLGSLSDDEFYSFCMKNIVTRFTGLHKVRKTREPA